jgi:diaminobutyrate-2-oxoglutarate transaminase
MTNLETFDLYESNVRLYGPHFPTIFTKGKNARIFDEDHKEYIDFFSGVGTLNYGHNPDFVKEKLIDFLKEDRITHALDMYTATKRDFIQAFVNTILKPRNLDFKIQFCGPTGANCVEAAIKLARLKTQRMNICSFSGGYHGVSYGALGLTGNRKLRHAAGAPLPFVVFLPYPAGPYGHSYSLEYIESLFADTSSGVEIPAAIILETTQSEGGVNVAPVEWLQGIRQICDRYNVLMIVDDIQVGCGRTGPFFSFERAGIIPDIITLSKAISGYGFPMSLCLIKRELDVWEPGQHTGTYRGNQIAFLAATAVLDYWKDDKLEKETIRKGKIVENYLSSTLPEGVPFRGLGLIWGVDLEKVGGREVSDNISNDCFQHGLIIEGCGRDHVVIKMLPPLTIEDNLLQQGCKILCAAIKKHVKAP